MGWVRTSPPSKHLYHLHIELLCDARRTFPTTTETTEGAALLDHLVDSIIADNQVGTLSCCLYHADFFLICHPQDVPRRILFQTQAYCSQWAQHACAELPGGSSHGKTSPTTCTICAEKCLLPTPTHEMQAHRAQQAQCTICGTPRAGAATARPRRPPATICMEKCLSPTPTHETQAHHHATMPPDYPFKSVIWSGSCNAGHITSGWPLDSSRC
jgi:hypothetical protein